MKKDRKAESAKPTSTVRGDLYDCLLPEDEARRGRDAKYPENLLSPLPDMPPSELVTEAQRRLWLLFDFWCIQRGDFRRLAIALACHYVRGFKIAKKRGRPRKEKAQPMPAQVALKLGALGRPRVGRRATTTPLAIVTAADRWLDAQAENTGRRPRDADWARFAAREEAKKKNLNGRRAEEFARSRTAAKKTELSLARTAVAKWSQGWHPVKKGR